MKTIYLLLTLALIVISSCTTSKEYTTQTYSIYGKNYVDTVFIPQSVILLPDSDGCFRPITLEISFAEPYHCIITFKCGSFYVNSINGEPFIDIQNFIFPYPHMITKEGWQCYNELLKNKDTLNSYNDACINGKYVSDIYMQGSKQIPFIFKK